MCLDLGHLMLYGYDMASLFDQYSDRVAVIHLHGVAGGQDHIALDRLSGDRIAAVMRYPSKISRHGFRGGILF